MSGRSNRGGRTSSRGGNRGPGRGRGDNRTAGYKSTAVPKILGMTKELGPHVFDHGDKGAADQVKITWEKLTNHVSTLYGTDIGTKLATNTRIHIPKPTYAQEDVERHAKSEAMRVDMATLLRDALQNEVGRIEARIKLAVKADTNTGSNPYLLVEKQNKIKLLELEISDTQPIQLKGESKTEYDADLKIYKSRVQAMEKYRGQAFSMIKGQCTLALESKMKCDSDYTA
jgi:hypothetical protein